MKRLRIVVCSVTIISIIAGLLFVSEEKIDERPFLGDLAPNQIFSEKQGSPPHYRAESGIVAFNSYDIVTSIRGYAGPIKVLLALNGEGIITGIRILEHRETKNYVHYMLSQEYLRQFLGKRIHDPIEVDDDIDAISRATVSVEALARTVRDSSREVAADVYGIVAKDKIGSRRFDVSWIVYLLFFGGAFCLYVVTRVSKKHQRSRDVILVASIAIVGIYLSTPFSILHVFNLLLFRFSSSPLWYVIVVSTLISVLIAGRFYCGWMCPFGALAEFIGRVPIRQWDFSFEKDDRGRRIKYLVLGVIITVVFVSRQPQFGNFETYVTLFSLHGHVLMWILVIAMLLINLRVRRFWCRYLCPVAALTGMLARQDKGYTSRRDCPMANRPDPLISECIRCNRCYSKQNDTAGHA